MIETGLIVAVLALFIRQHLLAQKIAALSEIQQNDIKRQQGLLRLSTHEFQRQHNQIKSSIDHLYRRLKPNP